MKAVTEASPNCPTLTERSIVQYVRLGKRYERFKIVATHLNCCPLCARRADISRQKMGQTVSLKKGQPV